MMRTDTPPCRLGENAPSWLALTSPTFRSSRSDWSRSVDPDPAKLAARAAAVEAHRIEREAKAEAMRAEKERLHVIARAEAKRLRDERSQRRRAEREAAKKSAAEIHAIHCAALAKARAAYIEKHPRLPPKPRNRRRPIAPCMIAPEGMLSLTDAARIVSRASSGLSKACARGLLPCVRQGAYVYVRLDDVRAYKVEADKRRREAATRARAANVARAQARRELKQEEAKAPRPYARLVKRGAA